ncbi:hypothetical protein GCM10027062_35910 [Nocardioides hungaricus]
MRLLLDNNLSPRLVGLLPGHDVEHVRMLELQSARDEVVLARAARDGRVLVSADTDFGRILATTRAVGPSVLLLRRQTGRTTEELATLLLANLPPVAEDLAMGAVVVIGDDDVRIRPLPILPGS